MNTDAKTLIFILFDIMLTHIIQRQTTLNFRNIIPSSENTCKKKHFIILNKYMAYIVNQYNTLNAANNIIKARPIYTPFRLKKF